MKRAAPTALTILAAMCGLLSADQQERLVQPKPYRRVQLNLPEAVRGQDLILHLGIQNGTVLQAWGEIPGQSRAVAVLDQESLQVGPGRLSGQLRLWVDLDELQQRLLCLLTVEAKVEGKDISGRFETRSSALTGTLVYQTGDLRVQPGQADFFHYGMELTGRVRGRMQSFADSRRAEMTLWTRHLLEGHASWQRYVTMQVRVVDGKVASLQLGPSHGPRAGWSAKEIDHDLAFSNQTLSGTITFQTPGNGGGLFGGTYRLEVKAKLADNVVRGQVRATRNGKKYSQETGLSGVAHGGPAKSRANAVFAFQLQQALESDRDLWVHVARRNGKLVGATAFVPRFDQWFDVKVGPAVGGENIQGKLTVQFPGRTYLTSKRDALSVTYHLDVDRKEDRLDGRYRCRFGQYTRGSGRLTGRQIDLQSLARQERIADGHDWPCWNGPYSSFAARETQHDLVDRLSKARLVWKSEDTFPARCQTTRYGEKNIRKWIQADGGAGSGGNSPILHAGRIFLHYFQPVEGPVFESYIRREVKKGNHVMPIMFATNGVDVALCIDAATGRTIWRKTIPGGRYFAMDGRQGSTKGWYTTNLAAADGKVYFGTSTDVEYCVEAATGRTVWKRKMGPTAGRIVVGDVMLRAERDLVGYDAQTGKTRWRIEDAGARYALPLRWTKGRKEYILAGNAAGQVRCVEPATGKVLWMEEKVGNNSLTMSARGDSLLCNGSMSEKGPGSLACYRISPQGAQHAWTIPSSRFQYRPQAAPAAIADGHAFVRTRKPEGMAVIELASGKIVAWPKYDLGASGYVQHMAGRCILQVDASHGPTPLLWFNVSDPAETEMPGPVWPTRHDTTASYYPILISHPMADGRIFIRGKRGIFCYDLRKQE
jgi:outer membrane protein assembly factor BamB